MLRYMYTFFTGLFVALFIGLGISVFYPAPAAPEVPIFLGKEPTAAEQQQQAAFELQQRAYQRRLDDYNKSVSIIALVCSILTLTAALAFASRLGIIADGLLLGGVLTLLYGIGRGMASGNDMFRFIVAAAGLVVTLVLGYMRFAPKPSGKRSAG